MNILQKVANPFDEKTRQTMSSTGLLLMRLAAGGMILTGHGWGKLMKWEGLSDSFPDPLGLGSATSLALAIFAEVLCSTALMLGFATRAVAIPLATTMLVAALIVHADDPWQKKEFALLYLIPFIALIFTGAGRFSLDHLLTTKA